MDSHWIMATQGQFGAAVDMLENALVACPDDLWDAPPHGPPYWYVAYHALFFLDLYLSGSVDAFAPPEPFTLGELDPAGVMPDRTYTKRELRAYLEHGREKARVVFDSLTRERAEEPCAFTWGVVSFAELLLYNMRHLQHHTAQLHLLLRQYMAPVPRWIPRSP